VRALAGFTAVTVKCCDLALLPGGPLSRRRPGFKRKQTRNPLPSETVPGPEPAGKELIERARDLGMVMDPATQTTPEEIGRLTGEMVELDLLEPVVLLKGAIPGNTYGPTKEFLEAFLAVRRQYFGQARTAREREDATAFALSDTVRQILEIARPEKDRAVMLARHMNYYFVMAIYISQPGVRDRLGIDALDFFPEVLRTKQSARRAMALRDGREE